MSAPGPSDEMQCSLLILLATDTEERALIAAAQGLGIAPTKVKISKREQFLRLGQIGGELVLAVCPSKVGGRVVMGAHGRLGSAAKAIRYREMTGAQAIVQLGMAFGIDPARQNLGDVLVSSSLIHYDDRRIVEDPDNTSGYLVDYSEAREEQARPELVRLLEEEQQRTDAFGVHVGRMLTGAARIHSATFRDEVIRGVGVGAEAIMGGEMEGAGLFGASLADDDPIWCVVKGISDFADQARDAVIEEARVVACRNAARFLLSALQNAGSH